MHNCSDFFNVKESKRTFFEIEWLKIKFKFKKLHINVTHY